MVRPVLAALRVYWQEGGFSSHGIALVGVSQAIPDENRPLFAATIPSLLKGDYLEATGVLSSVITDDDGRVIRLPGEVALTERAHSILDGWPGAAPEELVENLLAVITATAGMSRIPAGSAGLRASLSPSAK